MQGDLKDRSKAFALKVIKYVQAMPNDLIHREIGRQLLRSGMSVGANTRAAFRGRSTKEFKAKLGIVIEEADESSYWLELLSEQEEINSELTEKLKCEANELTSIFVSIQQKTK